MWSADVEARWRELRDEGITGLAEWREQHPRATLTEIEATLDECCAHVRARMLQDTARASAATDVSQLLADERPCCPECRPTLEARGQEERTVRTTYDRPVTLRRSSARCPACGAGLVPPG
jgi:hypothetical protein